MHLYSHALALIDFVVVVKSDIRSASKFRPIKDAILALAAKQIQIYKNLENEQISTEDEDDDKERRTEDEEIDGWESLKRILMEHRLWI
jgi:hypothetical protein